jgi:flagellar protein FliO/FliZ
MKNPLSQHLKISRTAKVCAALFTTAGSCLTLPVIAATTAPGLPDIASVLNGLVIVVLLILGCGWLIRRSGRFSQVMQADIRVISRINIGQREKIALVEVGQINILIGIAPGHIQTLHVFEHPVRDGKSTRAEQGFAGQLQQATSAGKVA